MTQSVLVVEDTTFMQTLMKRHLEPIYTVHFAGTADQGVEAYKRLNPDVVLMDYTMPGGKTGLDALTDIISYDPSAKVILCSALPHRELALRAIQIGAKDYLNKPFTPPQLLDTVQRAMRKDR
jgi:two-component system chemotaxis response regulator CheY